MSPLILSGGISLILRVSHPGPEAPNVAGRRLDLIASSSSSGSGSHQLNQPLFGPGAFYSSYLNWEYYYGYTARPDDYRASAAATSTGLSFYRTAGPALPAEEGPGAGRTNRSLMFSGGRRAAATAGRVFPAYGPGLLSCQSAATAGTNAGPLHPLRVNTTDWKGPQLLPPG